MDAVTITSKARIMNICDRIKEPDLPEWYGKYNTFQEMIRSMEIHYCHIISPDHNHGCAIDDCYEDIKGFLFVSNGEYGSQVNFCPMCGYKAKKSIGES